MSSSATRCVPILPFLSGLQNIAFTQDEYRRMAVHFPDHPLYGDFIQVIKDPVFRTKRVWHDFDFPEVDNMSREEARERLTAVPVSS